MPWPARRASASARVFVNCNNDSELYSFHTGGVVVLMGDGSVKFVGDSIGEMVIAALATGDVGDIVGEW